MKINYVIRILLFIVLIAFFTGCKSTTKRQTDKPLVAITKAKPRGSYRKWLRAADSGIHFVNLYEHSVDSALSVLDDASGLLLTGGADIHPVWYNQPEDTVVCNGFDLRRDTLEYRAVQKAIKLKLPILGICRGMQMLNVASGGSLIPDIPKRTGSEVPHREKPYEPVRHSIIINQASLLYGIAETDKTMVLSNHHQAVDKTADRFRVVARTADDLPEALERKKPYNHPFLLGVQFHPEAMAWESPVSLPVARQFQHEVKRFYKDNFMPIE